MQCRILLLLKFCIVKIRKRKILHNIIDVLGNMAAFDMSDPKSIVSPGGVGFDINCGVRLLRTNLNEKDVQPIKVCNLNY